MRSLISLMVREGLLSESRQGLLEQHKRENPHKSVIDILLEEHLVDERRLAALLENNLRIKMVDLGADSRIASATQYLDYDLARRFSVFPLSDNADGLEIATNAPFDLARLDSLRAILRKRIRAHYAPLKRIHAAIDHHYKIEDILNSSVKLITDELDRTHIETACGEDIFNIEVIKRDQSPVSKLVNTIFSVAIRKRASDIHIEPQPKCVQVRFRIDGHLRNIMNIPNVLRASVCARIKVLTDLNIAECRKTQDGRTAVFIDGRKIDLRISITPVYYGEKVVMRLLDSQEAIVSLNRVGMPPRERKMYEYEIGRPQGMVLLTGPTGCGKTSTLYASLNQVKKREIDNIVTIEDPIEYLIDGINQIQINPAKGVTFAAALRSILRQDPNIILVGEIRDQETAKMAFRASMTGHLVFSTLHTTHSIASITRLRDIGLEGHTVASALSMVVAQRLIRVICPECRIEDSPDLDLLEKFKSYIEKYQISRYYRGQGCESCDSVGFQSRTAIFEILKINDKIKYLISKGAPEAKIYEAARQNSFKTLAEAGVEAVAKGLTSLSEIERTVDFLDLERMHSAEDLATVRNPF